MVKEIKVPAYLCESCGKTYDKKLQAETHEKRLAPKTKPFAYKVGQEPLWVRINGPENFTLNVRIKERFRNDNHTNGYSVEIADVESVPKQYRKFIKFFDHIANDYYENRIFTKEPKIKKPTDKSASLS